MTVPTFTKAIDLVCRCGQTKTFLHNFGEPLLHPLLCDFIRLAHARGVEVSFFSNGLLLDGHTAHQLVKAGLREIWISAHVPGELERIQIMLKQDAIHLLIKGTFQPTKDTVHTWSGQVRRYAKGKCDHARIPCLFEREQAVVILWDGRVNVCCIDSEGTGISGTVDEYLEDPSIYRFRPIALCNGCDLMRGEEVLS